jgi:hypothetical protein
VRVYFGQGVYALSAQRRLRHRRWIKRAFEAFALFQFGECAATPARVKSRVTPRALRNLSCRNPKFQDTRAYPYDSIHYDIYYGQSLKISDAQNACSMKTTLG